MTTTTERPAVDDRTEQLQRTNRILVFAVILFAGLAVGLGFWGFYQATMTSDATAIPNEIAAMTDDWYQANDRGDGSVVELYLPSGYHLYGDRRIDQDNMAAHFSSGGGEHEWITEPLLVVDEGDGRYVVVRGIRNTSPIIGSDASALMFEIMTTTDNELRLAQTAWFYKTE